uniref:Uncharacterized protein n=1 Tax=virus sp. ctWpE22 TaxID=2826805 RepID=A0A8S5R7A1_9VIRU|nr:MAG TPA: hypothetical protein [virus sp. ctWpE22]
MFRRFLRRWECLLKGRHSFFITVFVDAVGLQ